MSAGRPNPLAAAEMDADGASAGERSAQQMEAQLQQQIVRFFKYCGLALPIWLFGYCGFSASWLMMAVLAYVVTSFMKRQRQARTAFSQRLAADEREFLANLDNLPAWVFFPDVERAEWLNLIIRQMWPFLRGYAVDTINDKVVPNVKANLPNAFKDFKFTSLDLGDAAPRIGGVKVFTGDNIRRSEIVMDLDLMYFGDCNIEVKWKTFKAGITNLEFRGKARVQIEPLMSRMPIAGCVSLTLLTNPYINFDLTNLGNILDMPGVRQMLLRAITDQVAALLVLPKKLVIPLASDIDLTRVRCPLPEGVLRLRLIEARELVKADIGFLSKGKSDPYVIAKVGQQQFNTKTIENTVAPVWDEHFEALVHVRSGQALELEVFDHDPGSKDDPLGNASVDIEAVANVGRIDTWVKLEDAQTGSVHLSLTWVNLVDDPSQLEQQQASLLSSALLFVEVDSCRGLPSLKGGREASALVSLALVGGEARETRVVEASPNPVFEEAFHFLVGNAAVETLSVTVWDTRGQRTRLGSLDFRVRTLLTERQMQTRRSFKLDTGGSGGAQVTLGLTLRALVEGSATVQPDASEAATLETATADTTSGTTTTTKTTTTSSSESAKAAEPVRRLADSSRAEGELTAAASLKSFDSAVGDAVGSGVVRRRRASGRVELTLRYSESRQCLAVVVHRAEGLVGQEEDDPYVKLFVSTCGHVSKKQKTKKVKNSLNPVFDETFEFQVSQSDLEESILHLEIVNHVGAFSRKSMGVTEIPLAEFQHNATVWYALDSAGDADSSK